MVKGIFYIDKDNNVVLVKEALALCPELYQLKQEELLYIILAYDYIKSPFARRPLEERKELAIKQIWQGKPVRIERRPVVKECIPLYESLIFDSKRSAIEKYVSRIVAFERKIIVSESSKEIAEYDNIISIFQKRIDEYQKDIESDEDKLVLRGGKKESFIEKLKRTKKLYELDMSHGV